MTPRSASAQTAPDVVCRIWHLPPVSEPADHFDLLDREELLRYSSYARREDRARFVTGRILAKGALAAELGTAPGQIELRVECAECGGPHGKPVPTGPGAGWELSITHSADRVLAALTRGFPVGVDVEEVTEPDEPGEIPEAELALNEEEQRVLRALPPALRARAFLTYWVRKEAVLKVTGEGLLTPMTDLWISPPDRRPELLARAGTAEPPRLAVADLDVGPDYLAAVAVLGAERLDVSVHHGAELLSGAVVARR